MLFLQTGLCTTTARPSPGTKLPHAGQSHKKHTHKTGGEHKSTVKIHLHENQYVKSENLCEIIINCFVGILEICE